MLSLPQTEVNISKGLEAWQLGWALVLLAALTFSPALIEISTGALFAGWFLLRIRGKPLPALEKKMVIALTAYVLLATLSFFWSEFPTQSLRGVLKVLKQYFLFLAIAEVLETSDRQKKAFYVLTGAVLVLAIDGMWQYVWGQDLVRGILFEPASSGPRISASFRNYGLLAAFLVLFLPLLCSQLTQMERGVRGFFLCQAAALGTLLLFWTRLRGAWMALLCGGVFALWQTKRRTVYLALLVAAVLGGLLFLPRSKLIHLDAEGKEQSLLERLYLWDRAIQVIAARPLTGTGINTYAVAHQKFDRRQNWRVRNYYAHNGYLQLAAETGLPSLVCFLAFLGLYFANGLRVLSVLKDAGARRTMIGFLSGMVCFLVLALIDTIFHNLQPIMAFWFLAGWGVAYQNSLRLPAKVSSPRR